MPGFASHFETEAVLGALPVGRNSPQKVPYGLYAEQLSGTAFTAPRHQNRRSWLYRIRPSADHGPYHLYPTASAWQTAPFDNVAANPNRLRWNPLPSPVHPTDFVDGIFTYALNGDAGAGLGIGIHGYAINRSMCDRVLFNADGELLIVPEQGKLVLATEMGSLALEPQQIAVIPRGVRFRVDLLSDAARGYVCENYGGLFQLPELGPIGSNGLANARDFQTPVAAFEDTPGPCEIIQKYQGRLWTTMLDHNPLDVVAWHGNLAPYRYDLRRFCAMNTVSFDHPDPSIFTVLTAPSDTPGTANVDFVIFPPRWMVAEDTFRPPWFHRNVMSEFMGLIHGAYDAKADGFVPGCASLHNQMSSHGPDRVSYESAVAAHLKPHKIEDTMAFMFESRMAIRPTRAAMESLTLQAGYDQCWAGFEPAGLPGS